MSNRNTKHTPRYETVDEAVRSPEGSKLYFILCEEFDRGLDMNPKLKQRVNVTMTYIGSHAWVGRLVWRILNEKKG